MKYMFLLFNVGKLPILDVVIVLVMAMGLIYGAKIGFIKSLTSFVGTFAALIGAFFLKNPISVLMYTYLPFFKFGGVFKGISTINILVYEAIAFLLVLSILAAFLKVLLKITGIIEKLLKATIILGIPSKIFGALFGIIETYLFVFIAIFFLNQLPTTNFLVKESKISESMLENTPILSSKLAKTYKTFNEIYDVAQEYHNTNNDKVADSLAFEILLKDEVITEYNAQKLIDSGKIDNELCKQVLENYKNKE